jgi:hypothetical protein
MCPLVWKLHGEIKKIYPLSSLLHISHMYGKVIDECTAPKKILIEHMYLQQIIIFQRHKQNFIVGYRHPKRKFVIGQYA